MSLDKQKHQFVSQQSKLQDTIVETIQEQCDELLGELNDPDVLFAATPNQQRHECVESVKEYLASAFKEVSVLPRAMIEVCEFTTCHHIAQFFQELISNGEVGVRVRGEA